MNNKQVQQVVIRRFSAHHAKDDTQTLHVQKDEDERHPYHVRQFFKMAEYRKRQILEKMLLDES